MVEAFDGDDDNIFLFVLKLVDKEDCMIEAAFAFDDCWFFADEIVSNKIFWGVVEHFFSGESEHDVSFDWLGVEAQDVLHLEGRRRNSLDIFGDFLS